MFTIETAQLVLKDKNGNDGYVRSLTDKDINKIKQVISDTASVVDPVSHLPIKATTTTVGVVQLADAEAVAAGTEGRIVDAKQLKAVSDRMANGVHYMGSVDTFADLPSTGVASGDMYNVKAAFEKDGIAYPAGTNVIADMTGGSVEWDVQSGDPSGFAKQAVANTFTAANDFTAGSVTVPTKALGDNSNNAASTAYVDTAIDNLQGSLVFSAEAGEHIDATGTPTVTYKEGKFTFDYLKGVKGDKGDTGPQGIQGEVGPKGDKGVKGNTGPQGDKGDKGDTGPQGPQGPQGPRGINAFFPGQLIHSIVPLDDAMLHPADGALINGDGVYADFVAFMAQTVEDVPNLFCTEEEWQASNTSYGECGKFVYDANANTIRLPKINGYLTVTNTQEELGKLTEAGLPNIEGYTSYGTEVNKCTGAFYQGESLYALYPTRYATQPQLKFSANLSNPIYGNSETVTTQNIKVFCYVALGTVTKPQIQVDIDNVLSDLANKADKDFSNVTAPTQAFKDMVVGWGMPDYSAGISISISENTNQSFTAPTNGILVGTLDNDNNNTSFSVNDKKMHAISPWNTPIFQILNKNDTATWSVQKKVPLNPSIESFLTFYPFKQGV